MNVQFGGSDSPNNSTNAAHDKHRTNVRGCGVAIVSEHFQV
jgi:hypothetical protein